MEKLLERFVRIRKHSEELVKPIITEDFSVQPVAFVSPPKWHLAHITWFWEQFVLTVYKKDYQVYNDDFSYLFNSYYNNVGKRVLRPTRGLMTRPSVAEVFAYRAYVDGQMKDLLSQPVTNELQEIIEIGINHEEQHQELFVYDIKYILGHQPTFPVYGSGFELKPVTAAQKYIAIKEGVYEIGSTGEGFYFDNELNRHKVYLQNFEIATNPVTNGEYLEFINAGGYTNFNYWHDDGWHWINNNKISSPLYWHLIEGKWHEYDLSGLEELKPDRPVKHISFYEAFAYAEWKGMRLPTEFEWEVASQQFEWGQLWEWTNSAYLPYPGFNKAPGALGEYNGKFMINTMVMRGGSIATPHQHSRSTYRNFFHPDMRWMYSGIRLAK